VLINSQGSSVGVLRCMEGPATQIRHYRYIYCQSYKHLNSNGQSIYWIVRLPAGVSSQSLKQTCYASEKAALAAILPILRRAWGQVSAQTLLLVQSQPAAQSCAGSAATATKIRQHSRCFNKYKGVSRMLSGKFSARVIKPQATGPYA
jgi:hypothetical protein